MTHAQLVKLGKAKLLLISKKLGLKANNKSKVAELAESILDAIDDVNITVLAVKNAKSDMAKMNSGTKGKLFKGLHPITGEQVFV
jgi:hypothetical protein